MIERAEGDILHADAEALVNTVNCVGIMGRGIALQFKKAYPENYRAYRAICDRKELRTGMMFVHDLRRLTNPRYIINFPTKEHWKGKSRMEYVESGLVALVREIETRDIRSVAVPPLGAGLGGLDWRKVKPMIEAAFRQMPEVRVLLYEPAGAPVAAEMAHATRAPRMTIGRATVVGLMRRYLAAVMDPFVSLLEIHKLLYFMQEAGEPLRLRYTKASYGPYAENLRHVLSEIEGHFIVGYGDAEDRPDKAIELRPGATEASDVFLSEQPITCERFSRVVELIDGFETPFGMELLSTVHWVASREAARSIDAAIEATYRWNTRKGMFTQDHIRIAWETLANKGWISAVASD